MDGHRVEHAGLSGYPEIGLKPPKGVTVNSQGCQPLGSTHSRIKDIAAPQGRPKCGDAGKFRRPSGAGKFFSWVRLRPQGLAPLSLPTSFVQ